ncbi:MAG TPA: hypothetical protein PLC99_16115 [Verrucomicrobiota bacterium]|nr:hypothetical protein [Verrucomicrobiota bacterium]
MNRIGAGMVVGTAAILLALPVLAEDKQAKEQEVKLADCPAAVQQTIKDNADGGQILEVEKCVAKDGAVVYEAEVKKADGKTVDVRVAADGKLIAIEADDEDEDDDEGEDDDDKDDDEGDDEDED